MVDVAYKPRPFKESDNTYIEQKDLSLNPIWIAKNRQQIIAVEGGGTNNYLVYQVPKGFTFYMTNLLHTLKSAATNGTGWIYVDGVLIPISILTASEQTWSLSESLNFNIPLKFLQGQSIRLFVGGVEAFGDSYAHLFGYLEPNLVQ